jgi:hypothetical protein
MNEPKVTDQQELTTTLFGVPVAVKGVNMLVVMILGLALAGLGYLFWERGKVQTVEHGGIVDTLKDISQSLDEQNFIVLSNEAERASMKARLRMPSSLKSKLKEE